MAIINAVAGVDIRDGLTIAKVNYLPNRNSFTITTHLGR